MCNISCWRAEPWNCILWSYWKMRNSQFQKKDELLKYDKNYWTTEICLEWLLEYQIMNGHNLTGLLNYRITKLPIQHMIAKLLILIYDCWLLKYQISQGEDILGVITEKSKYWNWKKLLNYEIWLTYWTTMLLNYWTSSLHLCSVITRLCWVVHIIIWIWAHHRLQKTNGTLQGSQFMICHLSYH